VKAQPSKSKDQAKVKKPAAKAKSVARAVKAPAKPSSKAKAKPVSAKAAKPAVKVTVKSAPKPTAKKAPAKVAKAPVKSKTPVKVPAKKAPAKTAKPAAKPVPVVAVKAVKAPVAAPKSAAKPAARAPAAKPAAPVAGKVPANTIAPLAATAAAKVPLPLPVAPPKPVRSSRLSQLTVPSMSQNMVASTAAKASYSQTMPSSVLAPPPHVTIKKDPKLANNWKAKSADQLSDAEVLAMPDTEYMNDKQMAFFRLKLASLKQDILNSAGETTEHLREDTVVVPDPADRATIEEEHALELRTRDRERKLLKKIEQSIQRIDAGDYGYCDETGEPIGVGRLLARPTATLSLEAQQRRELKQKMFGD
jgi:DnaK suppressor protein